MPKAQGFGVSKAQSGGGMGVAKTSAEVLVRSLRTWMFF